MSKSISPESIWAVIAAGVLIAVAGVSYAFYSQSQVATTSTEPQTSYNTAVLQEGTVSDDKNVYLKTVPLKSITQASSASVQYDPNADLGKTDLSRFE